MEYYCLNLGYFAVLGLTLTGKELPKKGIGLPKATISHFPTVQKTPKTPDKCIEPLKPGCSSTLTHRWVLQTAHSTIYYVAFILYCWCITANINLYYQIKGINLYLVF